MCVGVLVFNLARVKIIISSDHSERCLIVCLKLGIMLYLSLLICCVFACILVRMWKMNVKFCNILEIKVIFVPMEKKGTSY